MKHDATIKENIDTLQIINHKKEIVNNKIRPKFKVGDIVRIQVKQNAFTRSYDEKYSTQQHTIESFDDSRRAAILDNDERVSLRRLMKVEKTVKQEKQVDAVKQIKKEVKVQKKLKSEDLKLENILEGKRERKKRVMMNL